MNKARRGLLTGLVAVVTAMSASCQQVHAASARQINQQVDQALHTLYATQPRARDLARHAKAVLVFPKILKAGFLVGGQGGEGALRVGGRSVGYYNIAAASFGLQAGAQSFSYVLFFMNDAALKYLQDSHGWSIGSGPSVVVVDQGAAASITSATLTQDVYAFPFGQRGLMAGIGLEGSKISEIQPSP